MKIIPKILLVILFLLFGGFILLCIADAFDLRFLGDMVFAGGCILVVFVVPGLIVSWAVLAIGRALFGRHDEQKSVVVDLSLLNYLTKAKSHDLSDQEIDRRCRTNGWSDIEIQEARQNLAESSV